MQFEGTAASIHAQLQTALLMRDAEVPTKAELVQHELKRHYNRRILDKTSKNARERRYRFQVKWIDRRQVFAIRAEPIHCMVERPQRTMVQKRSFIKEKRFSVDSRARWHGDLRDILRRHTIFIGVNEV